jgi:hypothetical protein
MQNYIGLYFSRPVTVAEQSKACTLSSLARKPGSWVSIPLRAWMFGVRVCVCVCVCVRSFFCVYVQVEALRPADLVPEESYRLSKI